MNHFESFASAGTPSSGPAVAGAEVVGTTLDIMVNTRATISRRYRNWGGTKLCRESANFPSRLSCDLNDKIRERWERRRYTKWDMRERKVWKRERRGVRSSATERRGDVTLNAPHQTAASTVLSFDSFLAGYGERAKQATFSSLLVKIWRTSETKNHNNKTENATVDEFFEHHGFDKALARGCNTTQKL